MKNKFPLDKGSEDTLGPFEAPSLLVLPHDVTFPDQNVNGAVSQNVSFSTWLNRATSQILNSFYAEWKARFEDVLRKELAQRQKIQNSKKEAKLAKEFGKHGVPYETEISPLFWRSWTTAVYLQTAKNVSPQIDVAYLKKIRRYAGAVNLLTKEEAPFFLLSGLHFNMKRCDELRNR